MEKSKRLFAILLSVAMIVTYMPVMAFAAAEGESDTSTVTEGAPTAVADPAEETDGDLAAGTEPEAGGDQAEEKTGSDRSSGTQTRGGDAPEAEHEHTPEAVLYKAPSCTEEGSNEYWVCTGCGKFFSDAQCLNEIEEGSWVIDATGHTHLTHKAAVEATETRPGNIEYWYCSDCDSYFSDSEGAHEITYGETVIPANSQLEFRLLDTYAMLFSNSTQLYRLEAEVPSGGSVSIKAGYRSVSGEWLVDIEEGSGFTFDMSSMELTLDGAALYSAGIKRYGYADIYAEVKDSAGNITGTAYKRIPFKELLPTNTNNAAWDFDEGLTILKGGQGYVAPGGCYTTPYEDTTDHLYYAIESLEVIEGEDLISIVKQGYTESVYLGNTTRHLNPWNIKGLAAGTARVKVTYTDQNDESGEFVFNVYVEEESFETMIYREDGSGQNIGINGSECFALPGSTFDLVAYGKREASSALSWISSTDVSFDGYDVEWSIDQGIEFAVLTPDANDTAKARVRVKNLSYDPSLSASFVVRADYRSKADGKIKSSSTYTINIRENYNDLYVGDFDRNLGLGESVTIRPEVRHYSTEIEGGYEVIEGVNAALEYSNDFVTDNEDGSFTITRKTISSREIPFEARWDEGYLSKTLRLDPLCFSVRFLDEEDTVVDEDGSVELTLDLDDFAEVDDQYYTITPSVYKVTSAGKVSTLKGGTAPTVSGNKVTVYGDRIKQGGVTDAYARVIIKDTANNILCDRSLHLKLRTKCERDGHTWDAGVITTPATEESDGVKLFTCTVCHETKTETFQLETSGIFGMNGQLTWNLDDDGTLTVSGNDAMNNYLAGTLSSVPWYSLKDRIQNIVIEEGVTSIGDYAFADCANATSVTMAEGLSSIGIWSFRNCTGLTSLSIPDSVKTVGSSALSGCAGLESISIPFTGYSRTATASKSLFGFIFGGTSYTGGRLAKQYNGESNYVSYYIPSGLTTVSVSGYVAEFGFNEVKNLTKIVLKPGATGIGANAFNGCTGITSITFPDGFNGIGASFEDCKNITEVNAASLNGWLNINFISEKSNPLSVGNGILYINGEPVTDVVIPDGVTTIKKYTFCKCRSITSITIPSSVTSIGSFAFSGCSNLTKVYASDLESWLGISFDSNPLRGAGAELYFGGELVESVVFPEGTESIPNDAFSGCSSLKSVTIPYGVTAIEDSAFSNTGITSITIPSSVKSIGTGVFSRTNLTSIVIPDSVESIGSSMFHSCESLTSAVLPAGLTEIPSYTFFGCAALTDVTIPDSVLYIKDRAFSDCSSLESVTLPAGLKTISSYAFDDCKSLKDIELPEGMSFLGNSAFYNCTGLTEINIPASVASIERYAFTNCNNIKKVYASDIGSWLGIRFQDYDSNPLNPGRGELYFNGESAEAIVIPDGMESIPDYAFCNCDNLKTVTIPESVTSIGSNSFYYCYLSAIVGVPGSTAETYANSHGITFISADGPHDCMEGTPVHENEAAATCGAEGSYDEVVYCVICGKELSRTKTVVPATGEHTWGEAVYEPNAYKSKVTATHECSVCGTEETETAAVTSTVVKAKCETAGSRTYTSAEFSNPAFAVWTAEEEIPAAGHKWNDPVYTWAADNTQVTASRSCRNDPSHTETETVNASSVVTKEATGTETGIRTWTPEAFNNDAFEVQPKEETIPKVVSPEEGSALVETALPEADEKIRIANGSSQDALGKAEALSDGSDEAAIGEAEESLAQALTDAEAAMDAAQEAYDAAQAYYNAVQDAQGGMSGQAVINGAKKAAALAGAKGSRSAGSLEDAAQKLAAAKLNKAAANNTLSRSKKAAAMIAMVKADQAMARAEEVAADPEASEAAKAEAADTASTAAADAVDAAREAEISAAETESLVAYANADTNIEEGRADDLADLVSETENIMTAASAVREDAERLQLSAEETALLADAGSAAETAKTGSGTAKTAADTAVSAVASYKTAADNAKTLSDRAVKTMASKDLSKAKSAVNTAKTKKAAAEKAVKAANDAVADAEGTLTEAKDKVGAASAAGDMSAAGDKLAGAETDIEEAKTAISTAETSKTAADKVNTNATNAYNKANKAYLDWNGTVNSKIPTVKSPKITAGSKAVTVKWTKATAKNLKKFDKIEIQVCTDSKFAKKNTIRKEAKKTKTSLTVKKLKSKKYYWVRVRNVKGSGSAKKVSKWSKAKKIRVK